MGAQQKPAVMPQKILSRSQIKQKIANGRKIVIVNDRVLKVDAWLPYHPGGEKAIFHMVGRDATNEVKAFHSAETQRLMQRYQIGRIQGLWEDFVPPIQGGTFGPMSEKHELLANRSPDLEVVEDSSNNTSEQESSAEPSPIFEPAEPRISMRNIRRGSDRASSESSATSLSTLALDDTALKEGGAHIGQKKTQQEVQRDLQIFPSLDPKTQTLIIERYKQLDHRLRDEGLYNCNFFAYLVESLRYTALGLLSYYFLQKGWYVASGVFLGMMWHQLVFTVHDAGHMGITHHFHIDSCIGMFIANWLGGLSCCWWKRNHNVHHIVTNSAEHDPDIQHMPFFAVSHRFFESLRSSFYNRVMTYDPVAKFMLKYQHYLYYPILTFGRFNLYALSWQYIVLGQGPRKGPAWWHRYFEMAGQLFFWYWFGYLTVYRSIPTGWDRFVFVVVSHAVTMPVHAQITLSHFAMSTADLGVAESFPQRMLRTTMDIDCPPWLDFFHGGLQFQAVHHLFPRMPRHNLRRAQKLVMQFCEDVGIPYALYGFVEGNEKVIGHLGEIARQARILAECQQSMTVKDMLEAL